MKRRTGVVVVTALLIGATLGCATIPPEAASLSTELGKRLDAIEEANLVLLHRFFDLKREEVDRFIREEWVPTLAEEFFSDPQISDAWETIVAENNRSDRLRFLVTTGTRLQAQIDRKRAELIAPLDDLEEVIGDRISEEYREARGINNAVTSFLVSAAEVEENRQRYLSAAGVEQEQIGAAINRIDSVVAKLTAGAQQAEDLLSTAEEYGEALEEIRNRF